jgi:transposase
MSGAHASALFYTLIEGAKAAGLNPSLYMHYLLKNASVAVTEADWEALLPLKLKNKDFLLAE